jgi:hypothetical protein
MRYYHIFLVCFILTLAFGFGGNCLAKTCSFGSSIYECPDIMINCPADNLASRGCALVTGAGQQAGRGISRTDVNACCKLSQDINFEGHSFKKGCIVGEQYKAGQQESYCLIDSKLWQLTIPAEAVGGGPSGAGSFDCPADNGRYYKKWGMVCLLNTIHSLANWLFYIMLVISVFLVCLAGFYHMTAFGDPQKAGTSRNMVLFALIGLILALVSRIIPAMVQFAVSG